MWHRNKIGPCFVISQHIKLYITLYFYVPCMHVLWSLFLFIFRYAFHLFNIFWNMNYSSQKQLWINNIWGTNNKWYEWQTSNISGSKMYITKICSDTCKKNVTNTATLNSEVYNYKWNIFWRKFQYRDMNNLTQNE